MHGSAQDNGSIMVCLQVYVAYSEGVNFKKALAGLLGLAADASIGSCLQRIRQLLDRQVLTQHLSQMSCGCACHADCSSAVVSWQRKET